MEMSKRICSKVELHPPKQQQHVVCLTLIKTVKGNFLFKDKKNLVSSWVPVLQFTLPLSLFHSSKVEVMQAAQTVWMHFVGGILSFSVKRLREAKAQAPFPHTRVRSELDVKLYVRESQTDFFRFQVIH